MVIWSWKRPATGRSQAGYHSNLIDRCRTSFSLSLILLTACAKHIPVRGVVVGVNAAEQTVIVSHGDIPHYMPAMSMPFHVRKPAELAGLHPGAQIEFELVARKSGSYIHRLR